jgi:GDP-L-fucose synthase
MILVTGGHGFLGRWVVRELAGRAYLAPRSSELNLLDAVAVDRFVRDHGITSIIHAAGFVGGIGLHKAHPGRVARENLLMGVNVLHAAALPPRPCHVVIVSTVCAYPEFAPVPTREASLYDGYPAPDTAAYGLAKRELHSLAMALQTEFGSSFSYVIPTNLYGPEDHFDEAKSHVVPALIRRATEAREQGHAKLVAWGDGTATRDLLYVQDCARGLVLALDNPLSRGEVINLSSGVELSIRTLTESICRHVRFGGSLEWDVSKPQGAMRRSLDPSKARRLLGFESVVPIDEGLRRTIAWFDENLSSTSTVQHG